MDAHLHLHRLTISNYCRIKGELAITADGKHVRVKGPNGCGKSSTIGALFSALQGDDSKATPEPIHSGQEKARIVLELGEDGQEHPDLVIERTFTESGSRLVLKNADGTKVARPQETLNAIKGKYALDPVSFLKMRPQDQLDTVLAVCGITPPAEEVERITGEKFPPRPGESADAYMARLSADDVGVYFVRRLQQNRVVISKQGAVQEQRQHLASMPPVQDGLRPLDELLAELSTAEQRQQEYDTAAKAVEGLEREKVEACDTLAGIDRRVVQIEGEMAKLQAELQECKARIKVGTCAVNDITKDLDDAKLALLRAPDRKEHIRTLREEIAGSQKHQRSLIALQQAEQRLVDLEVEHETAKNDHLQLDLCLGKLRTLRKQLLEGIDLGVAGLEVGQGELRLHGVSFKQASQAQKIRVSCAVRMKQRSRLRLIIVDDAEHLDGESQTYLMRLAAEQGWQVFMTCVSDDDSLDFEMIDAEPAAEPELNGKRRRLGTEETSRTGL